MFFSSLASLSLSLRFLCRFAFSVASLSAYSLPLRLLPMHVSSIKLHISLTPCWTLKRIFLMKSTSMSGYRKPSFLVILHSSTHNTFYLFDAVSRHFIFLFFFKFFFGAFVFIVFIVLLV